jgi:hypothetical protein
VSRQDAHVVSVQWLTADEIAEQRVRRPGAVELPSHRQSGAGLPLADCRLSPRGTLEGFFA